MERGGPLKSHLAADAEARAKVEAWSEQGRLLRTLYDPTLDEPVPARLNETIAEARGRAARPTWWWQAAAAVVLLALGGVGGWFGAHWFEPPPTRLESALPREAALAHRVFVVEKRHPVEVAGQRASTHLEQWLSRRMDAKVSVPDLSSIGWNLVGGRLLSAIDGPASQLMYEDRAGRRITVYMTRNPANRETAFLFRIDGSVRLVLLARRSAGLRDQRRDRPRRADAASPRRSTTTCARRSRGRARTTAAMTTRMAAPTRFTVVEPI